MTNRIDEIATADAAEAIHELGDDDFALVVGQLLLRRHANFSERVDLARVVLAGADISPEDFS